MPFSLVDLGIHASCLVLQVKRFANSQAREIPFDNLHVKLQCTLFGLILTFGSSFSHQSDSQIFAINTGPVWENMSCFVPIKHRSETCESSNFLFQR